MPAEVERKPTLPTLTCLSPEEDSDERVEALLREDRELKRRREEIKADPRVRQAYLGGETLARLAQERARPA